MKVTVVGVGMVGSTFAYRLLVSGLASEIVLIDRNHERALGEAEDLADAVASELPVKVIAGDYADSVDSDFVVISAGFSDIKNGTRLDLCQKNAEIMAEIMPKLVAKSPKAFYLVASNPVDVMTYAAIKYSGLDYRQVIGSGTQLDSARFRLSLGEKLGVAPKTVSAYILGEHGDSEVPIFSRVSVNGIPLDSFLHQIGCQFSQADQEEMTKTVKTAAYRIIERKQATYYGIASSLVKILRAIYRDEHVILPVSTLAHGEYDLQDICLSLPTLITAKGAEQIFDLSLSQTEYQDLLKSADILREFTSQL